MDTQPVPMTPERQAQLEQYAKLHDQTPAEALDELLSGYFDTDPQEYDDSVKAIAAAYENVKAGRTRPAEEFFDELATKYGFPR